MFPKIESLQWTFIDKQGGAIDLEWCKASSLESVRSVYVDAYAQDGLYRAFFEASGPEEAKGKLSRMWSRRAGEYQDKLDKKVAEAYFAVAKKNGRVIGFALFDTKTPWGRPPEELPPKEVYVSPVMILPEAQGTGLGKELLFSILRRLPGLEKISLTTYTSFPSAGFYRHLGFREFARNGEVLFFEWLTPNGLV